MTGCDVVFYDVVGRKVMNSECKERRAVIDISQLVNGVYFVEVVDRGTGLRTVRKLLKE
jgi:hypothetical protein